MENNLLEKQEKLIEENGKRKASELHTQKLFNDLSMSYKNLEQFSFIVSHNLRAPLANIIGLSKLIEKEELTLDNKKIIGGIESAADILDNVLADLNYILQLKTQKIEAKSSINFEKSLHKIVSDLMSEHHISGLNIDTLYDKSIEIYTIKSLLEGILYQVIQNAIKFKKNDTELKISIALEQINDQTQISITDYGIGIDMPSHQHKLFSLYGKINTDYPGKGLGLCIVKIYTELLNGAVRIESEPLQFTKVIITV
jgi:light-regulated signal transduction histidine kinase (bacteriophytochrome)